MQSPPGEPATCWNHGHQLYSLLNTEEYSGLPLHDYSPLVLHHDAAALAALSHSSVIFAPKYTQHVNMEGKTTI